MLIKCITFFEVLDHALSIEPFSESIRWYDRGGVTWIYVSMARAPLRGPSPITFQKAFLDDFLYVIFLCTSLYCPSILNLYKNIFNFKIKARTISDVFKDASRIEFTIKDFVSATSNNETTEDRANAKKACISWTKFVELFEVIINYINSIYLLY